MLEVSKAGFWVYSSGTPPDSHRDSPVSPLFKNFLRAFLAYTAKYYLSIAFACLSSYNILQIGRSVTQEKGAMGALSQTRNGQREWRYNIGRVTTHWGFYPIFNWSFEIRLDHNSPLSACSRNGKFVWQGDSEDPRELDSVEEVLGLLQEKGLPHPPFLHEVFSVMRSRREELEASLDDETRQEIFIQIHEAWKKFIFYPFSGHRWR